MSRIEVALRKAQTFEDDQIRLYRRPVLKENIEPAPDPPEVLSPLFENIRREIDAIRRPILGVCSLESGEGTSTVTAFLGRRFAREGRTLAIDCDFASPSLHDLLGTGEGSGLSEILFGEKKHKDCVLPVPGTERLSLLPAGRGGVDALSFLGTSYSARVFEELKNSFDLILFNAPPDEASSATLGLCLEADGIVWVVRSGNRELAALEETLTLYQHAGVNLLGAVLNGTRSVRSMKHDRRTSSIQQTLVK